jgi:hypothetical protein
LKDTGQISPKHFSLSIANYSQEGIDTKYTSCVFMMATVIAVILAAGCTSAPVKETSTTNVSVTESQATSKPSVSVNETQAKDRYVQINLLDGSYAGGKYISETAAFTTIAVMYTYNPNVGAGNFFNKGSGKEVAFKNSLINTITPIDEPTAMIDAKLSELNRTNPH